MTTDSFAEQFLGNLRALAESAFPKRCANCGCVYDSAQQFLAQTRGIAPDRSGLKSSEDDDGTTILEVFRNCVCGSTLMDLFSDRRDMSEAGAIRRQRFGDMLQFLVARGLARETARGELIKVLRGEGSAILKQFRSANQTSPPASSP
jgi:hypothetical protein